MKPRIVVALAAVAFIMVGSAPAVWAGAQDTGELASCEIASAKGIPILAEAGLSIDLTTNLASVTVQTLAVKPRPHVVVLRALVGPDIGVSPMEYVCQVLNGDTIEGGATLAQQILAAAGLSTRTIAITKKGIFGCDVLPCLNPGLRPEFGLIPGSAENGLPTSTALGAVILHAVKP
jgi:hypothetical protein